MSTAARQAEAAAVSADERNSRRTAIRTLLERRDELAAQAANISRALGTLQWQAEDPRSADLANPEPDRLKIQRKTEDLREAQRRVDDVMDELVQYAAGQCELASRGPLPEQPQRSASADHSAQGARPSPPPLRVTIMTEAQLERRSSNGLRETLVVLCSSTATATVAEALGHGAIGVELHSSAMAVLDSARQHCSERLPYVVERSLTALPNPSTAARTGEEEEEEEEDLIDLGNGISYMPWSSQPLWRREEETRTRLDGMKLLYAAPSAAQLCGRAAHAKVQILCGWCNISACVRYIGQWYSNPTSSRADLYEMELTELAERNTDIVLLCSTRRNRGDLESGMPSSGQILAGVLLYQLMVELETVDIDFGDPSDGGTAAPLCTFVPGQGVPAANARCQNCGQVEDHPWHRALETDGWTTRTVLGCVIEAVRRNDPGWHELWRAAYEQERDTIAQGSRSSTDTDEIVGRRRAEEELLASMHIDSWASGMDGHSVPEYDRQAKCFFDAVCFAEQPGVPDDLDNGDSRTPSRL